MKSKAGRIIQVIGIIAIVGGIIYEVLIHAGAGYISIIVGSPLFALGTRFVK